MLDQASPVENLEVILVDAGSTDGSVEMVREFEGRNVRELIVPGCTEPEGQTIGIEQSVGDVLMFTNSDIYVPHFWIEKHLEWLNKGYDAVSGGVFWGGDKFASTWNNPRFKTPFFDGENGFGLGFSNASMSREFFHRMGGFQNIRSQHDAEFSYRILKKGAHIVIDPRIMVYHDHPMKSPKGSFIRAMGYSRNQALVDRALGSRDNVALRGLKGLGGDFLRANAVKAFLDQRPTSKKWGIDTDILRFLLIRFAGLRLGELHGLLSASLVRNPNLANVKDVHVALRSVSKS